jgi:glucose-6-phosphate 1-dehydrogenase
MIHPNSEIKEFDIIIIGSTGDLSIKKILPALMRRFIDGQIPENSNIFCIARQKLSTDDFLDNLKEKNKT